MSRRTFLKLDLRVSRKDVMDCRPPDSSVHEIFQARILEWVAGDLSETGVEPVSPATPALQAESLLLSRRERLSVPKQQDDIHGR